MLMLLCHNVIVLLHHPALLSFSWQTAILTLSQNSLEFIFTFLMASSPGPEAAKQALMQNAFSITLTIVLVCLLLDTVLCIISGQFFPTFPNGIADHQDSFSQNSSVY